MEGTVKHAVNRAETGHAISSGLDRLTASQAFAQNIVVFLMKTPMFTAAITKVVKIHAEMAVMETVRFYISNANVGNEKKGTPPSTLMGRSFASSASSKDDRKIKSVKTEAATILDCHGRSAVQAIVARKTECQGSQ